MRYILPFLICLFAAPATGQVYNDPQCAPAAQLEMLLERDHNVTGLIEFTLPNGVRSILVVNPDTGVWAHIIVRGSMWCVVAEGTDSKWYEPETF